MPRYPCHLRASIVVGGQRLDATVLDLGPGGAYIASGVLPTAGTDVLVALATPGGTAMLTVPAKVLYTVHRSATRKPGFAAQWTELTPALLHLVQVVAGAPDPRPLSPQDQPADRPHHRPTPTVPLHGQRAVITPSQAADPRRGETRPYKMVRIDPPIEPPTAREPVIAVRPDTLAPPATGPVGQDPE